MPLLPPAAIDDLADRPDLRDKFLELWNDDTQRFLGGYVTDAASNAPNYVDPRIEPPVGEPVKIPWNGFPRLLSRWYDDEQSTAAKERAETTADVTTPILSWVEPRGGRLRLLQAEQHRVPLFGERAMGLARPLRRVMPDGSLGAEVPRVRRQQDEYLEWHASADAQGRLEAITFTAEPPDYWMALAVVAPERVLELYRQLVGPQVAEDDIFHATDLAAFGVDLAGQPGWFNIGGKGTYDELNPWTTTRGIVHLTHRANTLGAEVRLAADASTLRATDFGAAPGPGEPAREILRIACGAYGGINRSSDPLIGLGVGDAVLGGARVTLTDPIGLYVATPGVFGLVGPQGQAIGDRALTILRGNADDFDPRILRFEVRLPPDTPFSLDQCSLDGRPLRRGGQVARLTTMHLYAQLYPDGADATPSGCDGQACRHPIRKELFLVGAPLQACPDEQDPRWLSETPHEALVPFAAAMVATRAAVAPVQPASQELVGQVDQGLSLSTSRSSVAR